MKLLNIKLLTALAALVVLATGCLKDKDYDDGRFGINVDKGLKFVEIAGPVDGFVNVDLVGSPNDTTVDIVLVRLASDAPADKDIQVTLALDPALVSAYNAEHGTSYTVPAASNFTIPSLTVTIPKGQRTATLTLKAKPNNLFGGEYALGVKLVSVSDPSVKISGNWGSQIVGLTIRNKYDGTYTMTGTLVDAANAALTAKSPQEVQLVTTGTNSVYLHNSGTSIASFADLFPILSAGSESAYGAFTPEFIFDANDNVTAVINAYGQPASNTRSAAIDPSGINKWDPSTKTLRVKWFMYQPSAIAGIRTKFDFTFTYVGPR